ncbi:uncharacterized protein LOC143047790 [Mytilus galloprovincialis]|uniref:uncharacterized protein LOC143047790 n=1 Tax=Mytilus galloprovincialis TaxID=29158 RepID=UPI003F7B4124
MILYFITTVFSVFCIVKCAERNNLETNVCLSLLEKYNGFCDDLVLSKMCTHSCSIYRNTTSISLMNDCRNVDDNICIDMESSNPGFCQNNSNIATKLCPLMCKKCFRCFSCNDIDKIENCNRTTTCNNGKQCFVLETLSLDLRQVIRLGCMDTALCSKLKVSTNNILGKRQQLQLNGACCDTDLCNSNVPITTTPSYRITSSTQTSSTACHQALKSCPPGFQAYNSSCFYAGLDRMTWYQAKTFCINKCAKLADFESVNELIHVSNIPLQTTGIHHGIPIYMLWTDGWAEGHSTNWTWSSTGSPINADLTHQFMPQDTFLDPNSCLWIYKHVGPFHTRETYCKDTNNPLCEVKINPE